MKKKAKELIGGFQKYFQETKAKNAVIGVSGGVDSACVFNIAVEALGPEKVIGVLMPHKKFSGQENLNDARNLIRSKSAQIKEIEISPYCEPFLNDKLIEKNDYVIANIMSRMRMVILYAIANGNKGIVLGTSNKTEILTGFLTKYGDGGIDVEVIGELWKTEVFALARHFGLDKFANKKPTAELTIGHFDEDEIGVSYGEIDQILKKIIADQNFQPKTDAEKRVYKLYTNSAHKRIMPPIIKLN